MCSLLHITDGMTGTRGSQGRLHFLKDFISIRHGTDKIQGSHQTTYPIAIRTCFPRLPAFTNAAPKFEGTLLEDP